MRRYVVIFVVGCAVVLIGGILFYRWQTEGADDDTGPPKAVQVSPPVERVIRDTAALPATSNDSLSVISVVGPVKRRRLGDEEWVEVAPGEQLQADDSIKTGRKAKVKLSVNDRSEIELAHRSELTVREIAQTVHRLNLVRGRIQVDYGEDEERVLTISAAQSDAVARTRAGRFSIQSANKVVTVATTTGIVELRAKKKSVTVRPGEMSTVLPGEAPEPSKPIPVAVMLRVAKPPQRRQAHHSTSISGQTNPGASVYVNNRPAKVNKQGKFRINVPLRLGENQIVVVAENVAGASRTKVVPSVTVTQDNVVDSAKVRWGVPKKNKKRR